MTIATTHRASSGDRPQLAYRPFPVTVARTRAISPSFVRVTFTGDDLDEIEYDGPDQRVKLYLPRPGHTLPAIVDPEWREPHRRTELVTRCYVRTYTIRQKRRDAREIDIDFVIHGDGPAASWAARTVPGEQIVIVGPNGRYHAHRGGHEWNPPALARDILVAGDESALPAIASIVTSMPDNLHPAAQVTVLIEVPDASDVIDLGASAAVQVSWLIRNRPAGSKTSHGELLVDAVRSTRFGLDVTPDALGPVDPSLVDTVDLDLGRLWEVAAEPNSAVYAWVAGEAGMVKAIRRHLVAERGIAKDAVTFMGYWRLGRPQR